MDLAWRGFQTERLSAQICELGDAARLSQLMTADISKWVAAWPDPLSIEDAETILGAALEDARTNKALPFVVVERISHQIIGWLKIEVFDSEVRTAELGYWIGVAFQRRGYAKELAKAAIQFAFSTLEAKKVTAGAQIGNSASLGLLHKLGMNRSHEEGVWAPARLRWERCEFWSIANPA